MPFLKLAMLGVLLVESAFACRCVEKSKDEAWSASDAVFSGRVLKVAKKPTKDRYATQVDFEVIQPWKGITGTRVSLRTGQGGADCGFPFEKGKSYLIFAYGPDDLRTDRCTRTSELEVAKPDVKAIKARVLRDVAENTASSKKLSWQFHEKDLGRILQLVLDDERLDAYFKIDSKPERKPLVILENQFTKKAPNLKKFGAPVVLVERKKTTEATPFMDISEVRFEKDFAHVRFFYTPERVKGEVALRRAESDWAIQQYDLAPQ